ncbi:hypothetical protein D9757_002625 [Collybiopsis confluens]|uniref:Uncharacterized protein n=1 Tax=Collybiopsis confluens TaxID=2823264 RepID=A0A8H5HWC9_9AGAR|nr:hypothetical protein D9757_002625 [Collybiopsis confluens]
MLSLEAAALAYLLSLTWLVCFIVMAIVSYGGEGKVNISGIDQVVPSGVEVTQKMQLIATSLEFALFGDLAVRSTWARRVEPDDEVEEKVFGVLNADSRNVYVSESV